MRWRPMSSQMREGLSDAGTLTPLCVRSRHRWLLGDQLRQYYQLRLKSRKVYKYIFWFLVDVSITNAFILHQYNTSTSTRPSPFKAFRLELAKGWMGDYNSRKRAAPTAAPVDHQPTLLWTAGSSSESVTNPVGPIHNTTNITSPLPFAATNRQQEGHCSLLVLLPHTSAATEERDNVVLWRVRLVPLPHRSQRDWHTMKHYYECYAQTQGPLLWLQFRGRERNLL